jgi:hypothetical protein
MSKWKLVFLRGVGFGVGFALMVCGIGGSWLWYKSRPRPQAPWNKQAIVAEFDYVRPQGENNNLTFHYVLQNNTDSDYRIDSEADAEITARLKKEKGFSSFANKYVKIDYPIFVPAKSRLWVSLNVPYPYPIKEKINPTEDEDKQYGTDVAKYVTTKTGNLDGFVLFDTLNRYEIDFPGGWEQRAAESSSNDRTLSAPTK